MTRIFTFVLVFFSFYTFAQSGLVRGTIFHEDSKLPFAEVSVMMPKLKMATMTNEKGEYTFSNVPYGEHDIKATVYGEKDNLVSVGVTQAVNNAPEMFMVHEETTKQGDQDNSSVTTEDANSDEENSVSSTSQSVSSALNAARDPFQNAATFGWGQFFFRMRGYENENNVLYLNGVPMNDLEEGGVFFNSWGGLNDVFRGRTTSLGLAPIDFNFGGYGLNTELDATASNQRKGTKITFSQTNRSYRSRIMLTHSSGLKKNGWAYSFSLSRRWANEGQIAGTYYKGLGYYAAVEKRWKKQGLNIMVVGSPLERGKSAPNTDEVYDLAKSNYYNPNWGWQNGKKRNSRVQKNNVPLFILNHDADLGRNTKITSAASYQFGESSQTNIDFTNGVNNPSPTYYKSLPSYQEDAGEKTRNTNYVINQMEKDSFQTDWAHFYKTNYSNVNYGNGSSFYALRSDVEYTKKLNFSTNIKSDLNDHTTLYSGINVQLQNNHNFARIEDLLGGKYFANYSTYNVNSLGFERSKYNLLDINLNKKVGDDYRYNYNIHFNKSSWFGQAVFVYNKIDFYLASELGYTNYFRQGNYKHGNFQNNSFGKSSTNTFFNSSAKGGMTLKLNGRNYVYANASIGSRAPFVDNVFVSPQTRNETIENPKSEQYQSAEIGYLFRSPSVKARLTLYATDVKHATDIKRYFSLDDLSFISVALQGMNKRYTGIEFGSEIKLTPALNLGIAATYGQAFYTNRAFLNTYKDNTSSTISSQVGGKDTVYMKNYYVPSGPQSALQTSLNYRAKRFWYATLSANYLARNWIDFAPNTRTKFGADGVPYGSEAWHVLVDQKKMPNIFTIDVNGGKSFKVNKYIKRASSQTMLLLNIGISNILNNKNNRLYGFENLRLDNSTNSAGTFASKYAFALGTQYFINLGLRF
jgi:hypothetical protein